MTIVLLIRHASNDYVKEGRLAGWIPGIHLNAQGQREADALARRLNHLSLAAVYSSPLERAVDTANAVAECQKLAVSIHEGLGEFRTGEWTGKLIKELEPTETWKQLQSSPSGVRLPGGETIDEVQSRMVATIDGLIAAHPGEIIAIVSHADPIKATIAHYLGMPLNQFQRIVISPASITIFFLGDHPPVLFKLNDSDKLPAFQPESRKEAGGAKTLDKDRKEGQLMPEPNILHDLNPVTHITAGSIGVPGKRIFYLQAQQGATLITLLTEKEQIAALSAGIDQLLERLGGGVQPIEVDETEMELAEPITPLFRIGQLGLGYDAEKGLVVLVAYELPEVEEPAAVNVVRFWATKEQMRALARHVAGVVAAGRPICVLCGRPIDPEGHFCPKRNGHGERAKLD